MSDKPLVPEHADSRLGDPADLVPSPEIVAQLSKLVLAATLFAIVVSPFVPSDLPYWVVLIGMVPFALMYAACWYMAEHGRAKQAAWTFVVGTMLGQVGALVMNSSVSEQALVSSVNLILFSGFMLGRRMALWVSGVSMVLILTFSWVLYLGWFPEPLVVVSPPMRLLALISTLMATGGVTYVGIQYMSDTIQQARFSEARMAEANRALQLASNSDERRALRAERIGALAKDLVGMNEPTNLSQEVAIGLREALGADVVMILGRSGVLIAGAGLGAHSEEGLVCLTVDEQMAVGTTRELSESQLEEVIESGGFDQLDFGFLVRAPHAPFYLLAAGSRNLLDATWTLQVGTNLLDAALLRYESERRMLQAQKMDALHRLSSGIAHDFNNLLTTILGGTEIAEFKAGSKDPIRGHLRRIREAGERASALTSKLMTFTRTAARAPDILDLSGVLSGMLPVVRRMVEESIHLVTHFDDGAGLWVDGDVNDFERIVFNLVANAKDALDGSGQIDIGAELRTGASNMVVLWVQDDGEGMGMNVRTRMFEPFFTTRKGKGATGLGMSIVYGVVQGIGGEVFVDSSRGRGTCIEVHIPLADEPARIAPVQVPNPEAQHGVRILVVEDAPDVRETLNEMLQLGGYSVESVDSGLTALERLKQEPCVDLVLSDVVMPSMGGFELAERMAELGIDVPLCLVSGYAAQYGADSKTRAIPRITKPFSLSDLLSFVAQHTHER